MKKQIWVVGAPKCGNTWLSRLLGGVLDSPVTGPGKKLPPAQEGMDRIGDYRILQYHMGRRETDEPIVFIYRDPRDVIVSAKFYWKMSSFDKAIEGVTKGTWPYRRIWHNYIQYWLHGGNANSVVTYEQLSDNAEHHVKRILDELDLDPVIDIDKVVKRQEFGAKKKFIAKHGDKMPYGMDVQNSMLRQGEVGDWRNHLNRTHAKRIHDRLWAWMYVLGYERDMDWWKIDPP